MAVDYLERLAARPPEARARAAIAAEMARSGRAERFAAQAEHFGSNVMKVVAPCNLRCDYCLEYEGPDQSWRDMPPQMSRKTVFETAKATALYAQAHGLARWSTTFHGGEALMLGAKELGKFAKILRHTFATYAPNTKLDLGVVTNGVLLSNAVLEVADKHDIRVVVSLDGDEKSHNRHRVNKAGAGSYKLVTAGIDRLRTNYNHLYGGLLAVIDHHNDPLTVYETMCAFGPPAIDLVLPYANWDNPPPAYLENGQWTSGTPYADWLIKVFDRWQEDKQRHKEDPQRYPKPPDIRFFKSIIDLDLGGVSSTEALGLFNGNEFIVRSDRSVELPDGLKTAYAGAVKTDMKIGEADLETVAAHFRAMKYLGKKSLSFECESCPVVNICGAHHIATRYWEGGFLNPSVYCADLERLIEHIQNYVLRQLHEAQTTVDDREIAAEDVKVVEAWSRNLKNTGMGRYLARKALGGPNVVTILPATSRDARVMVGILKESLLTDYVNAGHGLTQAYWLERCNAQWKKEKEAFFRKEYIDAPGATAYVAVRDGEIVGFSLSKEDELAGLYVQRNARRRRIAAALFERSMKGMLELGYRDTWASVATEVSKSAAAFYAAKGFVNSGETLGEGHNGRPGTFVTYRLNLADLEKSHQHLRTVLGIGDAAANVSTQLNLSLVSLLSVRLAWNFVVCILGRAARAIAAKRPYVRKLKSLVCSVIYCIRDMSAMKASI